MSGFFSNSSSRRRYPDPNMGGKHYKKRGLFGMLSGLGSFSGSGSSGRYGGYPNQGYSGQNYPNQGYQGQPGYQQSRTGGQKSFQPDTPAVSGQTICPKCGTSVPPGSKFCLECGERIASGPRVCLKCGKPLPAGAKFCLECGTPVQS